MGELIKFRQGAWDVITYRKHEPRKVYTSASDEKDLVVLGNVMFRHKNGQRVTQEFVGNFIFDEVRDEEAHSELPGVVGLKAVGGLDGGRFIIKRAFHYLST